MIKVVEVKTKKQKKLFVDFPIKLYKDNEFFVPLLRGDELGLFDPKKNVSFDECEIVFYLAYRDDKVVGRICGIIQKQYNEKTNSKRVRFTRFDFINDLEVAKALLVAVEEWAKSKGMDTVHGPLGFNDLDREGLLIEGFDKLATFEENYNYPYYSELLEKCGYSKEIDYLAFNITLPEKTDERIKRIGDMIMKKYGLHIATAKNLNEYLKKYKDGIFDVLDDAYNDLYGVIPYTEKLRKSIISQFKLILNKNYIISLVDKDDRVVACGISLPSLAKAVQKSKGKLFPFGAFRMLYAKNHGDLADFALVGVRKEFQGKGLTAVILDYIISEAKKLGIKQVETNHSLETNHKILQTWKNFDNVTQHKRFRCYIKDLNPDKEPKQKSIKNSVTTKKTNISKKTTAVKKSTAKSTNNKKVISKRPNLKSN